MTAENGSELDWKITVTIAPGIFFTYDGTEVVLTKGVVDSDNSTHNEAYGNGVPYGGYVTDDNQTACIALKEKMEFSATQITCEFCAFVINGKEPGDAASDLYLFIYETAEASFPEVQIYMDNDNDITFNIIEYGDVGEYIRGTFSCTDAIYSEDGTVGDDVEITNGRFNILRLVDDVE